MWTVPRIVLSDDGYPTGESFHQTRHEIRLSRTELLEGANGFYDPHVVSTIVDDAGHFLHLERPDAVNALIADFCT